MALLSRAVDNLADVLVDVSASGEREGRRIKKT
jgi:hypothetical protein